MFYRKLKENFCLYWFQPRSPKELGLFRVFYFSAVFYWHFYPKLRILIDVEYFKGFGKEFYVPISYFHFIDIFSISPEMNLWATRLFAVAILFSAAGIFTSLSTKIAFVGSLYFFGFAENFRLPMWYASTGAMACCVFAFSKCGDAFSIDSQWAKWKNRPQNKSPSGEYNFPILMFQCIVLIFYTLAGLSKLKFSGLEWVSSNYLAFVLLSEGPIEISSYVRSYSHLLMYSSALVLFVECISFIGMFSRMALIFCLLVLMGMHSSMFILMEVKFTYLYFLMPVFLTRFYNLKSPLDVNEHKISPLRKKIITCFICSFISMQCIGFFNGVNLFPFVDGAIFARIIQPQKMTDGSKLYTPIRYEILYQNCDGKVFRPDKRLLPLYPNRMPVQLIRQAIGAKNYVVAKIMLRRIADHYSKMYSRRYVGYQEPISAIVVNLNSWKLSSLDQYERDLPISSKRIMEVSVANNSLCRKDQINAQ